MILNELSPLMFLSTITANGAKVLITMDRVRDTSVNEISKGIFEKFQKRCNLLATYTT